jgi:hypothetical protein
MGARWRSVLQPRALATEPELLWRSQSPRTSMAGCREMSPIEHNVVPPNFPRTFSNIIGHDNICLACSSSNR